MVPAVTGDALDGVTISGGEPFDQPEALAALLALSPRGAPRRRQLDSTSSAKRLSAAHARACDQRHPRALERSSPTLRQTGCRSALVWRGSSNQTLVPLSDTRGRARYADSVRGEW
jgi:anaerobic ribonucleoside-triphosphate reductase activating protein